MSASLAGYFGHTLHQGAIVCLVLAFIILLTVCILLCVTMFSTCNIPLLWIATICAAISIILCSIAFGLMFHGQYSRLTAGEWTCSALTASLLLFLYSLGDLL
ncbi:hypothetical protein FBUS_09271 [Fasciolopsis buskii]|uniref:Uncharacterized protein n=1 Tax=Fasciolopsis buskii TaxID=27845 RepID=A0A8E0RKA0_9TREM|nr:hypothetical protein FBUS_09271 [Fasciolopsis buski]